MPYRPKEISTWGDLSNFDEALKAFAVSGRTLKLVEESSDLEDNLKAHLERTIGAQSGSAQFVKEAAKTIAKRSEFILTKGISVMSTVIPDWRGPVLEKEDIQVILGPAVLKHPLRAQFEPSITHLESQLIVHAAFTKTIDKSNYNALVLKDVGTKIEEGKLAMAVMFFCVYHYKKIPKAENRKSRGSLLRELRAGLKSRHELPASLMMRINS